MLAYARAMITWQDRHRYCGVCGAANESQAGGFVMACTASDCGYRSFPRLDPAIIVLVRNGERCLLGRQHSWPAGRVSTIAGFVEPGESLEAAVRREGHEDANRHGARCDSLGSQPWPFPSALMLGFHADAASDAIRLNDNELAEARWVSRAQILDRDVLLPPRASIAWRLIERWFDNGDGPPLSALDATR